jgi:hypothetical protein
VILGGWIETAILARRGQGATRAVYLAMAAMGVFKRFGVPSV